MIFQFLIFMNIWRR